MTGSARSFPATYHKLVATRFREVAAEFLARHDLAVDDIDRFVCHPGGAKVVAALEDAFGLGREALAGARGVLRDFGNMSAATVMFVLERMLAEPRPWDRALMNALGPGFTAGFIVLDNR